MVGGTGSLGGESARKQRCCGVRCVFQHQSAGNPWGVGVTVGPDGAPVSGVSGSSAKVSWTL
ncbi:MAG: hypothetical protein SFV23_24170 [Planctomycetaceae bacterium]|nr:hypothetical protein [Planctomycetaceae bacterium]